MGRRCRCAKPHPGSARLCECQAGELTGEEQGVDRATTFPGQAGSCQRYDQHQVRAQEVGPAERRKDTGRGIRLPVQRVEPDDLQQAVGDDGRAAPDEGGPQPVQLSVRAQIRGDDEKEDQVSRDGEEALLPGVGSPEAGAGAHGEKRRCHVCEPECQDGNEQRDGSAPLRRSAGALTRLGGLHDRH